MQTTDLTKLATTLDQFADVASTWARGTGPSFTCREADAVAALLAASGNANSAQKLFLRHLVEDSDSDTHAARHHLPVGPAAKSLSVLGGTGLQSVHAYVESIAA